MTSNNKKTSATLIAIIIILLAVAAIVATPALTSFNVQNSGDGEHNSSITTQVPTTSENTETSEKTDSPPSDSTSTPSTTLTITDTATQAESETQTHSETQSGEEVVENTIAYRRALYENFMTTYNNSLDNSSVNVTRYSVDPKNESATIYWTQDPGNQTSHVLNRQSALANYAAFADIIRESNNATAKAVPKRMYFSIRTPDDELYMLTYIEYLTAFKYSEGTTSVINYQTAYEKNAEYGPAHPRYEENQTATATSV